MPLKAAQALAVLLTALALVPAGAHFFELPNKIGLPRDDCLVAQGLYRGWALFGFVLFAALAVSLGLAVAEARLGGAVRVGRRAADRLELGRFLRLDLPGQPDDGKLDAGAARLGGGAAAVGYSHAANAGLLFLALRSVVLSVVLDGAGGRGQDGR